MEGINVDQLVPHVLNDMNKKLGVDMEGHCIFISAVLVPPLDDELRVVIEDIFDSELRRLIVMLETVERMVSVMRTHYDEVSFVIPNYA